LRGTRPGAPRPPRETLQPRPALTSLRRYALISIAAAIVTIGLKTGAYLLTGSVGLLSDALESLVNLAAAIIALIALTVAARPADEEHAYGHTKAEYFASGFEGALVLFAAATIVVTAVPRLLDPQPLESVGLGLSISVVAALVNLVVARVLLSAGRRYHSITLEADAQHLMADVWTSAAVIVGVGAAELTGWIRIDAILAILVALNIVRIGVDLLRRSMLGLLDTALPEEIRRGIVGILEEHAGDGVQYHALRTRQAGARRFISVHILVPGQWTVQRGHDLLEDIEDRIRERVPNSTVFTHLEPLEDPISWEDLRLEREPR
jgi:cation diffusion facilitator family transporter